MDGLIGFVTGLFIGGSMVVVVIGVLASFME